MNIRREGITVGKALDEFNELMRDSVNDPTVEQISKRSKRFYYPNAYALDIKEEYISRTECKTKEFSYVPYHKNIKFCSVSSSARLCYLYFKNDIDVKFEIPLQNPTGKGYDTQLDARKNNVFYECKCQEIIEGENEKLRKSYKPFLEEFDIYGLKDDGEYITATLKEMNINLKGNYDNIHFNVKQLFAHLLALKRKYDNEKVSLQYVIFKPRKDLLVNNSLLTNIYSELENEIKQIWASKAIKIFLKNHQNIELPNPILVYVNGNNFEQEVMDF